MVQRAILTEDWMLFLETPEGWTDGDMTFTKDQWSDEHREFNHGTPEFIRGTVIDDVDAHSPDLHSRAEGIRLILEQ